MKMNMMDNGQHYFEKVGQGGVSYSRPSFPQQPQQHHLPVQQHQHAAGISSNPNAGDRSGQMTSSSSPFHHHQHQHHHPHSHNPGIPNVANNVNFSDNHFSSSSPASNSQLHNSNNNTAHFSTNNPMVGAGAQTKASHMLHHGGMGDGMGSHVLGPASAGAGGYPVRYYNTGAELGSLSNPLATIPDALKPRFGPSRDEMKDRLAESLASDSTVSCLPGYKRDDARVNCVAALPYGMQNPNPVMHTQRKMFGQERPSTPIRRAQAAMGKQDFGEAKFQSLQRMSPFPQSNPNGNMPVIYPQVAGNGYGIFGFGCPSAAPAAGISCLGTANQAAQGHFRRGRAGPWASMGTPGLCTTSTNEAKAAKEGYRKELQKQIEQSKLRKEEEQRRDKDINDHPLGAGYAQAKTYIPPKCLSSNMSSLEMGMRLGQPEEMGGNGQGRKESMQNNNSNRNESFSSTMKNHVQHQPHQQSQQQQQQNRPGQNQGGSDLSSKPGGGFSSHSTNNLNSSFENSGNSNSSSSPWGSYPAPHHPPPVSSAPATPGWPMMHPPPMMPYAVPFPQTFFPQPAYPPPPTHPGYNMQAQRPPLNPNPNGNPNSWQGNPNQQSWADKNAGKIQQLRPNFSSPGIPNQGNNGQPQNPQQVSVPNVSLSGKPLSNIQVPNPNPSGPELPEDLDKLIEELPLKQYTWQTSDQLPDPALKTAIYKEELRRQIIQKKKDEEEKALKEREEEEKLERRIREYDERMRREVVAESHREGQRGANRREVLRMNGEMLGNMEREKREAVIREKTKYQEHQHHQHQDSGDGDSYNPNNHNNDFDRDVDSSLTSMREQEIIEDQENSHHDHFSHRMMRKTSPPIPTVQKRLETQSGTNSSLLGAEHRGGGSNKNLNVLSEMLNSLGLETRRMELKILKKLKKKDIE